jgi:predicted SprT family Zn-dependent metalloprotease
MNLLEAKSKAIELMTKHGLFEKGWSFKFNNRKNSVGVCYTGKKIIYLSRLLIEYAEEKEVIDTILHEIAHALTPGHNHDKVWKQKAIEIGCNGKRCYDEKTKPNTDLGRKAISKYKAVCVNGHEWFANRRRKRDVSCSRCSNKYDERFILIYKPNV